MGETAFLSTESLGKFKGQAIAMGAHQITKTSWWWKKSMTCLDRVSARWHFPTVHPLKSRWNAVCHARLHFKFEIFTRICIKCKYSPWSIWFHWTTTKHWRKLCLTKLLWKAESVSGHMYNFKRAYLSMTFRDSIGANRRSD